jgi:hypothetical protein
MKKILLVLGVLFIIPHSLVLAQTTNQPALPSVYVQNATVDKKVLNAGDRVRGSFMLVNDGDLAAANVSYSIALTGGYTEDGLPTIKYDEKILGSVNLNPGQQQPISFNYTLPAGVSGENLGFHLQAYTSSGLFLGFQDIYPLFIQPGDQPVSTITASDASLVVKGVSFNPQSGPTVYQNDSASYKVSVKNEGEAEVSLVPTITFYKFSTLSKPILTMTASTSVISAHGAADLSIDLPTFSYTPGVYVGKIAFTNANGGLISAPQGSFRYIIFGDSAQIQSVRTDAQGIIANEPFQVTVEYTASPLDITNGSIHDGGYAVADVTVTDAQNRILAHDTRDISLNQVDIEPAVFNFVSPLDAASTTVSTKITKDGKVLSDYTGVLTRGGVQASPEAPASFSFKSKTFQHFLTGFIIVFILALFAGVIWRSRHLFFVLVGILFIGSALFLSAHAAHAFVATRWGTISPAVNHNAPPNPCSLGQACLQVGEPYGDYAPGAPLNISGSFQFVSCGCSTTFYTAIGTANGVTKSAKINLANITEYTAFFSISGYRAPNTVGTYYAHVRAEGNYCRPGTCNVPVVYVEGDQQYKVSTSAPGPAVYIHANGSDGPVASIPGATMTITYENNRTANIIPNSCKLVYLRNTEERANFTVSVPGGQVQHYADTTTNPTGDTWKYTLTCTNVGGAKLTDSVTVNVIPPPVTAGFSAACDGTVDTHASQYTIIWTAYAAPQTQSYTYTWAGTGGLSGTGQRLIKSYPRKEVQTATVTVRSASGQVKTCTARVDVQKPGTIIEI